MTARIERRWDRYNREHYMVLRGTHTVLDGSIMALSHLPTSMMQQVVENIAELNSRRQGLGLEPIELA